MKFQFSITFLLYQGKFIHDNADIMIGIHGAGCAQVAWMKPGSLLIEVDELNKI